MIDIESALLGKSPRIAAWPAWVRRPLVAGLRRLVHERDVNDFLARYGGLGWLEFIDQVFDYFRFGYTLSSRDRDNIPATGRVVIVANHPMGALDGLALIKMVAELRPDVRILANDLLLQIEPLREVMLPVDNLSRKGFRRSLERMIGALEEDRAVIVFPSGEVSRAGPAGIRDGKWLSGFLHAARRTNSPILPVHVGGRNSSRFYSLASLSAPLGTLMLPSEMFRQRDRQIALRVGGLIPLERFDRDDLTTPVKLKLLRKHVYRLGRGRKGVFVSETGIARPESRQRLREELREARRLGETADGKRILLFDSRPDSAVMREIGRLREITFRRVGEGTGNKRDLDDFDNHYRHLILWDEQDLEIAGAYRLGEVGAILDRHGPEGLYGSTIFQLEQAPWEQWRHGLELGRSFVQPRYWGRRSLDYLWVGLGAYLREHPEVRWLFGPVTIPNLMPPLAKELLVGYYQHYHGDGEARIRPRAPFRLSRAGQQEVERLLRGDDAKEDFRRLRHALQAMGAGVPALYKQYIDVAEPGGARFLAFGVDAGFGYCTDGLVVVDVTRLKPEKRARYIGDTARGDAESQAGIEQATRRARSVSFAP
ncbi:GNAT family N-acyltransferase [Halomonas elongata]|uniref:L-ornithine N(alpha)-acyltransferase n=1 Tax=Halomonas elongata (strain ATCC 33173 / DSM 2581 / NBRC 15536 / NCIMB 2198 / 1H9) TaxID=768066 RepID=E1V8G1_HALED|nr:lysophospholipid acyltransferase family protein [Halomonas elongata]MBW5799304.1 lysophospholipid acyltransferase family protein [Halomonas elongata]WBF17360.1 lysophospholipid acyltransferase family protein [Halomonas elongata]WPU46197.1 lysophospholipid acyltransferase family protein [Halomonas elongata DSM 2581]WVI70991.1 lysophospholipid acyltransferase family protein [Halomonas elongata]CBV43617.1 acyltransferase domain protein [Halomonas elongata DSM 2581]